MSDNDLIRRGDAIAAIETCGDPAVTEALGQLLCCSGNMCGCRGATVEELILHDLRALPAVQVTVKPLEWKLATTVYDPGEAYEAICPVGVYVVAQDEDSPSLFNVEYGVGPDTFHKGQPLLLNVVPTIEAAKTAAQADYDARILAAIEPAPVTPAEAVKVPRIIPFHTAAKFGVCIGGRWDGWIMIQHPDGYWVSHHKPEPVDPSIVALRAIGKGEA